MRAVDTNVLLRLIAQDDERQAAVAEAFIERGAWVPTLALAETIWVLGSIYKRSTAELVRTIEMLLNHQHLMLQDYEAVEAALHEFRAHPALGFSDCLMLQIARKSGHLPLGTFDRALARLAGTHKL